MSDFAASLKKLWGTVKTKSADIFSAAAEKTKKLSAALRESSSDDSSGSKRKSPLDKALTIIGLALCAVFTFMLICNLIIIIKGSVSPEKPPSVFGITPMVVLSGSMSGDAEDHIETGDLIFVGKADPEKLKVGDVIAFMEGRTTVTHRIIRIETTASGSIQWITKGDANNTEDSRPVTPDRLVGIYRFRLAKVGDFALFLQQPVGMLIFIGIPCLAFLIYDIIRRQRAAVSKSSQTAEMEAEIERLRRLVGETPEPSDAPARFYNESDDEDYDESDDEDYDESDDEDYDESDDEDYDESDDEDYDESDDESDDEDYDESDDEDYDESDDEDYDESDDEDYDESDDEDYDESDDEDYDESDDEDYDEDYDESDDEDYDESDDEDE